MEQENDQPLKTADTAVTYTCLDGVGTLVLNRPETRNAMRPELLDAFASATQQAKQDEALRVLVLTGNGSCFSAGADLRLPLQREDLPPSTPADARSYAMYEAFLSILDIEVPVIAAASGHAVGGGFGLFLCSDLRFAAKEAKLGANFVRLGITPGMGITYLLPRLIGDVAAAELLLTGTLVSGTDAKAMGLVSRALPQQDVLPAAYRTARKIAQGAPTAVRETKRLLRGPLPDAVRRQARLEAVAQSAALQSDDFAEGLDAFLNKREPRFIAD